MTNSTALKTIAAAMDSLDSTIDMEVVHKLYTTKMKALSAPFRIGQKVAFDTHDRGIITGVITQINGKAIEVSTPSGLTCLVSQNRLHLV